MEEKTVTTSINENNYQNTTMWAKLQKPVFIGRTVKKRIETSPVIRAKAPLRLGLAGGGTDVSPFSDLYGGSVLNATIDMHAYCTIEVTDNNKVVFYAADRDEYEEFEAEGPLDISNGLILHKAVYNRVIKEYNGDNPLSLKMTTYSDAVAGSGLGSSSTLVVAMLRAYTEWLNIPLVEYDLAHLAFHIERVDAGLSGGKQDQYAAAFGGVNFMEFMDNERVIVNPLRIKSWILNELENSFVLYYTGSSRESANIIEEQIKNTTQRKERSIEAMLELKADSIVMKESILKGDFITFSKYLAKSWEAKKKMASSITNPAIDAIYDLAMEAGAYGGKVSGAGGGGFMMLMVNPVHRIRLIEKLSQQSGKVINFHFTKYGAQAWKM